MREISCDIVKDLLPLYYDNVCSDDSKNMIEEHLVDCPDCKSELKRLQEDFQLPHINEFSDDQQVIKEIASSWKKSKRKSFSIGAIVSIVILSLIFIMVYSEFSQKNFVDAFITNPNDFDEKVDRVTIWEQNQELNQSIAILRKEDEQFDEVRLALSSWQVRKTFKKMNHNEPWYKIDITSNNQTFHILISQDGIMNINTRQYELVSGTSIEELIDLLK